MVVPACFGLSCRGRLACRLIIVTEGLGGEKDTISEEKLAGPIDFFPEVVIKFPKDPDPPWANLILE